MLTTGVRTPIGVKVFGTELSEIERAGEELERLLSPVPGTRSVFYERIPGRAVRRHPAPTATRSRATA